jgi:flagellar biosynthesis chaperone FliJ
MEASERPQLALDDGTAGDGSVRAIDGRLVIERLEVADARAAKLVRERAEAGHAPAQTVRDSIEIGARVLEREGTAAEVDYVRAEFERHAAELRERLGKALESGDQQLAERIAQSFDGSRDGSVQKQIDDLVGRALEEQRTALLRLFSAEEGANPLQDFKGAMIRALKALDARQQNEGKQNRERIEALTRQVIELREGDEADRRVAEAEEAGTRKGLSFEDRVHEAIERIACARGDAAHHTGGEASEGGGRKGDTVVEAGAGTGSPLARVVFEAKDKRGLSKQEAWRQLNGALDERSADFAVLVVAGDDQVPSGREPLHEYEGNKLIVAVDRDEPDGLALEIAYRLALARVAMLRDRSLTVDAAAVKDEAEAAIAALKEAQKVRRAMSGAETSIGNARRGLDAMVDIVRAHIERIDGLVEEAQSEEAGEDTA